MRSLCSDRAGLRWSDRQLNSIGLFLRTNLPSDSIPVIILNEFQAAEVKALRAGDSLSSRSQTKTRPARKALLPAAPASLSSPLNPLGNPTASPLSLQDPLQAGGERGETPYHQPIASSALWPYLARLLWLYVLHPCLIKARGTHDYED